MSADSCLAIVLAAGKGTRMESDLPKVLCPAAGRPLIRYVLQALRDAGIHRIAVVIGYRGELVRQELAGEPGVEFVEQTEQLGTGHAVMVCRDQLKDHEGPVVIVTGDSPMLQSDSLRKLLDEFRSEQPACVLGTLIHDRPHGLGRIVRDERGQFQAIVEEKDADENQRQIREVNMSTYVFAGPALRDALGHLTNANQQGEYYVTDAPGWLLSRGERVHALPVLKPVEALSVNTVEELTSVEQILLGGQ